MILHLVGKSFCILGRAISSKPLSVAILFIPAFIASVYGLLKPGGSARRRPVSSESSRTYGTSEGRVSDYDPSVSRGKNDYSEDEFTKGTDKDNFADMDSSRLPPDSEVSREERTPDSVPDDISSQKRLRAFICLAVFVAMFFLFLVFLIDVIGVPVTQTKIQNASNGTVNSQIGGAVSSFCLSFDCNINDTYNFYSSGVLSPACSLSSSHLACLSSTSLSCTSCITCSTSLRIKLTCPFA